MKGDHETAKDFLENAMETSLEFYGSDSEIVAKHKANLAMAYSELNNVEAGLISIKSAVKILSD